MTDGPLRIVEEIDQTQVALAAGKGARLGELSGIEGVRVPAGFCVTPDAFQQIMAQAPSIGDRLDRLSRLKPDDRDAIGELSAEVRRALETIAIPDDLARRSPAWLSGSASRPPGPSGPARGRRICRRRPSRASMTPT